MGIMSKASGLMSHAAGLYSDSALPTDPSVPCLCGGCHCGCTGMFPDPTGDPAQLAYVKVTLSGIVACATIGSCFRLPGGAVASAKFIAFNLDGTYCCSRNIAGGYSDCLFTYISTDPSKCQIEYFSGTAICTPTSCGFSDGFQISVFFNGGTITILVQVTAPFCVNPLAPQFFLATMVPGTCKKGSGSAVNSYTAASCFGGPGSSIDTTMAHSGTAVAIVGTGVCP